jgi:hypothetical protein
LPFIPLGIAIIVEYILNLKEGMFKKILLGAVAFAIVGNAAYSVAYVYSPQYVQEEQKKFEFNYTAVAKYIYENVDLTRIRVYLNEPSWNGHSFVQFFFSSHILNRVVEIDDDNFALSVTPSSDEDVVFILRSKEMFTKLSEKYPNAVKRVFSFPGSQTAMYLIHIPVKTPAFVGSKDALSCVAFPSPNVIQYKPLFSPYFSGDYELMYETQPLYSEPSLKNTVLVDRFEKARFVRQYNQPNMTGIRSLSKDNEITVTLNSENKSEVTQIDNRTYGILPDKEVVILSNFIRPRESGSYYFKFDFEKSKYSYVGIRIVNTKTNEWLPIPAISELGEKGRYETILYLERNTTYVFYAFVGYQEKILSADRHPGFVVLTAPELGRFTDQNILLNTLERLPREQDLQKPQYFTLRKVGDTFVGSSPIDNSSVVSCSIPYSKTLSQAWGNGLKANGSVQAFNVNGNIPISIANPIGGGIWMFVGFYAAIWLAGFGIIFYIENNL